MEHNMTVQLVATDTNEKQAYYANGSLVDVYSENNGQPGEEKLDLESKLTKILLGNNVERVDFYKLSENGMKKFFEKENKFLKNFSDYEGSDLRLLHCIPNSRLQKTN